MNININIRFVRRAWIVKACLRGTILSHTLTSLRHAYDTKKSHKILKQVVNLTPDNRGLKSVVSVS